jgi:hypothetical protein
VTLEELYAEFSRTQGMRYVKVGGHKGMLEGIDTDTGYRGSNIASHSPWGFHYPQSFKVRVYVPELDTVYTYHPDDLEWYVG